MEWTGWGKLWTTLEARKTSHNLLAFPQTFPEVLGTFKGTWQSSVVLPFHTPNNNNNIFSLIDLLLYRDVEKRS